MKRHASMNRLYRIIWNSAKHCFVVAPKITKGHCGSGSGHQPDLTGLWNGIDACPPPSHPQCTLRHSITQILGLSLLGFSSAYAAPGVNELPSGGQITQGSGSISQSGNTLTVQQNTDKMVGQWNSFNIGEQATVNFQQPNAGSIALNRITDSRPSEIYGKLNANGQVYLLNGNGIIFGKTAQVDVGGLVASTQQLNDNDFLNGKTHFTANGSTGQIDNQGRITAHGGVVAFIAPQVSNSGSIENNGGAVALAAGDEVTLDFNGDGLINVTVDKATLNALAENKGLIQADAGTVIMTAKSADAVMKAVVNNQGVIQAKSLDSHNGRIILDSGDTGATTVSGTLDVSSGTAQGGDVTLLGGNINLQQGSQILAQGNSGGGNVRVGGDWQGSGDLPQATTVNMDNGAMIDASASQNGDGGKVVLWSDVKNTASQTAFNGAISAKGAGDGKGGQVETSGHQLLIGDNAQVDTSAPQGQSGNWLLDPNDFTIAASGGNITGTALSGNLASTSINISTTTQGTAGGNGDIFVNDNVNWSANTLTLNAERNVQLNAVMNATGSAGLVMNTGGSGAVNVGFNPDGNFKGQVNLASGTSLDINGSPYTIIRDINALQAMSNNPAGHYSLGSDIDASSTLGWNAGAGFAPMLQFSGVFDGLGHRINELRINRPSAVQQIGLFGGSSNSSIIRNVGVVGGAISGSVFVGGLVGYHLGTLSNSYSSGSVSGNGSVNTIEGYVGGLVGISGGTLSNSYYSGAVSGSSSNNVGGLVGGMSNGSISNSYSSGTVSGNVSVGGLVGDIGNFSSVSNSYSSATVNGYNYVGGLVGANYNTGSVISNSYSSGRVSGAFNMGGLVGANNVNTGVSSSYWDTETSSQASSAGGTGLTTAQMKRMASFSGWDFTNIWNIVEGVSPPTLRAFSTSSSTPPPPTPPAPQPLTPPTPTPSPTTPTTPAPVGTGATALQLQLQTTNYLNQMFSTQIVDNFLNQFLTNLKYMGKNSIEILGILEIIDNKNYGTDVLSMGFKAVGVYETHIANELAVENGQIDPRFSKQREWINHLLNFGIGTGLGVGTADDLTGNVIEEKFMSDVDKIFEHQLMLKDELAR